MIVGNPANAEVAAGLGNVAGFFCVADDLETPVLQPIQVLFGHEISLLEQNC